MVLRMHLLLEWISCQPVNSAVLEDAWMGHNHCHSLLVDHQCMGCSTVPALVL